MLVICLYQNNDVAGQNMQILFTCGCDVLFHLVNAVTSTGMAFETGQVYSDIFPNQLEKLTG